MPWGYGKPMKRTLTLLAIVGCSSPSGTSDSPAKTTPTDSASPETGGDGGEDGTDGGADGGADGADGGTDGGGDGGETGMSDWTVLPNSCAPGPLDGTDPFVRIGFEINQTGPWFTEILDVHYLPDIDQVLTAGQGGVAVFDVSTLTAPDTLGHIGAGSGGLERFYHVLGASPGRAWATHRDVGLQLISTADPRNLSRIVQVAGIGYEGLTTTGDHLYVADLGGNVDVYNIFDETSPAFVGSVLGLGRPWDVVIVGDAAYVADGDLGVVVLSLADPAAPVHIGSVSTGGQAVRIVADDDGYLYVAASAGGLEIYETSDPLAPTRVASLDVGGGALDVAVHDGLLGVATQEAVVLFDIGRAGTPEAPLTFAYEETEQFAMSLDAADGRWMVGDWNILGVWELGTDPAPAMDLSLDLLTFLDEAETRELRVTNRGSADLDLAGIEVPAGIIARVDRASIPRGQSGTISVEWDGVTEMGRGTSLCVASDDPSRTVLRVGLASGAEGEGKALGQAAPDFTLEDLDGNIHRLSDELGHPVVLAYFATW